MAKAPTYTPDQLKDMAGKVTDYQAMKILSELINEEIDLYSAEEMKTITEATLILYNRSLILKFIK